MEKEKIEPVIEREHPAGNGIQKIYRFENNYGASVVQFKTISEFFSSYTDDETEWELAVIKFNSEDNLDFDLIYNTPITDDVIGHLKEEEVQKILNKIKKLK